MGNKHSCCVYKSSNGYRKKDEERYIPTDTEEPQTQPPPQVPSSTNLQHISEREPDGKDGPKYNQIQILWMTPDYSISSHQNFCLVCMLLIMNCHCLFTKHSQYYGLAQKYSVNYFIMTSLRQILLKNRSVYKSTYMLLD